MGYPIFRHHPGNSTQGNLDTNKQNGYFEVSLILPIKSRHAGDAGSCGA
jgi:hypothetical protein